MLYKDSTCFLEANGTSFEINNVLVFIICIMTGMILVVIVNIKHIFRSFTNFYKKRSNTFVIWLFKELQEKNVKERMFANSIL